MIFDGIFGAEKVIKSLKQQKAVLTKESLDIIKQTIEIKLEYGWSVEVWYPGYYFADPSKFDQAETVQGTNVICAAIREEKLCVYVLDTTTPYINESFNY